MAIQIIKITIDNDFDTGEPASRTAHYTIRSGGGVIYKGVRGGLPLAGAVQPMLDAEALYADALAGGNVATAAEIEMAGARAWYVSNPGTKAAVFDKTVAQEVTDITAMLAASFPTASAAVKAGWLQLLMSSLLDTRVNAHDRDLV